MASFVGSDRIEALEEVLAIYEDVKRRSSPASLVISAPAGWGKSAVVHEFYRRIACEQDVPYWPPSIANEADELDPSVSRKRTAPAHRGNREARPPFMWWGLLAGRRPDGSELPVLNIDDVQWFEHAEALARCLPARDRLVRGTRSVAADRVDLLGSVLGCFVPPVSYLMAAREVVKTAHREGRRFYANRSKDVEATAGGDLSSQRVVPNELAESVARLHTSLGAETPLVIFIEDAHHLDGDSLDFLSRLWDTGGNAPILTILAAQSDHLGQQRERRSGLGHAIQSGDLPTTKVLNLAPIELATLRDMVRAQFPDCPSGLSDALARRYHPNPLALRLAMVLPAVQRRGRMTLREEDVRRLPTTIPDIFAARWRTLPEEVQRVLGVAALAGTSFAVPAVEHACESIAVPQAKRLLHRARGTYYWLTEWPGLDRSTADAFRFVEPEGRLVVRQNVGSVLSGVDEETASEALATSAVAIRRRDRLDELSVPARALILSAHVATSPEARDDRLEIASSAIDLAALVSNVEEASRLRARAHEVRQRLLGTSDLLTLEARFLYGVSQHRGRDLESAFDLLSGVVQTYWERGYHADRVLCSSLEALGQIDWQNGNLNHAAGRLARAYDGFKQLATSVEFETADLERAAINRAGLLHTMGQLELACELHDEAISMREQRLGSKAHMTLVARRNRAQTVAEMGMLAEARDELSAIVGIMSSTIGKDHPETLHYGGEYAQMHFNIGEVGKAIELLVELTDTAAAALGAGAPETLKLVMRLAGAESSRRNMVVARDLFELVRSQIEAGRTGLQFLWWEATEGLASLAELELDWNSASGLYDAAFERARDTAGQLSVPAVRLRAKYYSARLREDPTSAATIFSVLKEEVSEVQAQRGERNYETLMLRTQLGCSALLAGLDAADSILDSLLHDTHGRGSSLVLLILLPYSDCALLKGDLNRAIGYASQALSLIEPLPAESSTREYLERRVQLLSGPGLSPPDS